VGSITTSSADTYTLPVAGGQTVSVLVTPAGGLQAQISLSGPGISATASSAAVGAAAALQTVAVETAGTCLLTVGGLSGTTGSYKIQVFLNAALSSATLGNNDNHTRGTAQNIDPSFVALSSNAQRGAASGTFATLIGSDAFGYGGIAIAPQFDDISPSGALPTPNAPILVGVDDGIYNLTSTNLAGFTFKLYNSLYNSVYVSSNGLITFDSGSWDAVGTDLTTRPSQATVAPFFDDLVVTGGPQSGVYWQVQGTGANARVVVQWNQVSPYAAQNGGLTFEAILNADGAVFFNYRNLNGSGSASATVGIKDAGTQGSNRLLISSRSVPSPFVGSGTSLEMKAGLASSLTDCYAYTLTAGQTTTLCVTGQNSAAVSLALEDAQGNTLATGTAPGTGSEVSLAINNFVAPSTGTYYAIVTGTAGNSYSLVVGRNSDFSLGTNRSFATAQNIDGTKGVLGDIPAAPVSPAENWYSINLTAGGSLIVVTSAPGSVDAQFVNDLNPQIQLYDPSAALVATSQGTGNKTLGAEAAVTGHYRIRVFGSNSTSGEYFLSTKVSATSPDVVIVPVSPNPRETPVSQLQIVFNEPVNGFTLASLSLSKDGGPNLLTSSQTLTTSDNMTYALDNLDPVTHADGTYTLSLAASSNITDSSGGFLESGAGIMFIVNAPAAVVNNQDSGVGSLRQALLDAAGAPGLTHTIQFALPIGPQSINLLTPLPAVTDPVIVALDATQNVTIALPSGTAWIDNSALTLSGSGILTLRGGINGTGSLTIYAGSTLTVNHIVQGALVIGGSAGNFATVTIAASDASGNPLNVATAGAAGAPAIAATSTVFPMTASTETSPPTLAVVEASRRAGSSGSTFAPQGRSSDAAGLVARQSPSELVSGSGPGNSAPDETERSSSHSVARVSPTSVQATSRDRRAVDFAKGSGELLRRDAVESEFDDANILEWVASTPAPRPSAADADFSLIADHLMEEIGRQWQN
jgi:hypothetical protein